MNQLIIFDEQIEERLLDGLDEKFRRLVKRSNKVVSDNMKFMEEAIHELLKARRILRGSYALGYFLDAESDKSLKEKVVVFELMQNDLEVATEQLSQMVNRLYLKTPRGHIISATQSLHRKRHEFLNSADNEFIPPDHPGQWLRGSDGEDSELFRAIEASLRENHDSLSSPSPSSHHIPLYHRLFVASDNDHEESDEHISDESESGNALLQLSQLMAMIDSFSAERHIGSICGRNGCIHRAVMDPLVSHNGYCSDRCCQLQRERERQQFRNRSSKCRVILVEFLSYFL
jgi:ankyrin repeat/IBR domain-containing protein 1